MTYKIGHKARQSSRSCHQQYIPQQSVLSSLSQTAYRGNEQNRIHRIATAKSLIPITR